MSDVKCASMLLEASSRDVEALSGMADAAVFADEIFGFHLQQATEKLLKAWLALLGETYPLTHDLDLLFNLLRNKGADVSNFSALTEYTPYAVQFRYEAIGHDVAPIERQERPGPGGLIAGTGPAGTQRRGREVAKAGFHATAAL